MDINFIPDNHWHMDINYHMPEGGYNQAISSKKWKVIHPKIHSHLFHNQWHMDINNHMSFFSQTTHESCVSFH